ncbi:MAG TPA: YceI family protein [Actinomycetota bacterium]|nr:YceI family protein [Actinomycetota bacterium]
MSQTMDARTVEGVELPPAGTWTFDKGHTSLEFVARHMLSKVRGRFTEFDGRVQIAERPEDSSVEIEITSSSIQTNQDYRDNHLRSGDFLEADEYPTLTFRSTAVRPTGGNRFELVGDLTIKDVTNEVVLDAEFGGFGPTADDQGTVAFFSARTEIDREDWDMTWNMAVETGGVLVGRKVRLEIDAEILLSE